MPQKSAFLHKKTAFGKKSTHYVNYSTRVCVKSSTFAGVFEKNARTHCKSTNLKYIIINRRFAGTNKNNMRKQIFTLLTLALLSTAAVWADDVVSATQTFTDNRSTCTWTSLSASVANGNTAGGDGLFFTASASRPITTSSGAVQGGSGAIAIVYVQVASATSNGTITMTSSSDASDRPLYLESYDANTNPNGKVVCAKNGSTANFTAADVISYSDGYYIKLTNSDNKDVKIKSFSVTLNNETYPIPSVVDPVFSLDKTSITTEQTAQIVVGNRSNMDGISFDGDVTFGTPGVVTVDEENGLVTPVAAGTTTINFNTSAVAGKYNASTGNSLTITVTEAVLVFDANGLVNEEVILDQATIETWDYLSCNSTTWQNKGWSAPYDGNFLDMKTNRIITMKVKNAVAFEVYVNGTKDRNYYITVGGADAVEYTQASSSGFVSSGVITTGTTGEVVIKIEGGSNTLYPVYINLNPAAVITPDHAYVTYVTTKALDFTDVAGLDAYVATGASGDVISLTEVGAVPANTPLLLHGTASTTYNVPVVASASAPAANLLVAGTGADINSASKYVLSFQDPNYVFAATNEQAATVPEGKAYLDLSGANAPSVIRIVENATNIMNVDDVENAVKFIENGKLYIKKNGVTYNVVGAVVK